MIDELIGKLQPLVATETKRASKKHGDKYASACEAKLFLNEGLHLLREEVEEMENFYLDEDEKEPLNLNHSHSDDCISSEGVDFIRQHALNAAAEAIQVAAVCEKIARGFEK